MQHITRFRALILGLALLISGPLYYSYTFNARSLFAEATIVELRPGMTLRGLSLELAQKGMQLPPKAFELLGRFQGVSNQLKSGEYSVPQGLSASGLLHKMLYGDVILHRVTLLEGWTVEQMLEMMNSSALISPSLVNQTGLSKEMVEAFGGEHRWMEGWFLPNTYFFIKGETSTKILQRAHEAMKQKLAQAWEARGAIPLKTMDDVLIVASIIEKESALDSERSLIAAVIYNRLRLKMPLQLDPTVIYALGNDYKGVITKKDLLRKLPHNTYQNRGLPPSPISCPSLKSIEAALHPADSAVLYFVAQGDGSHIFTRTLEEHQKAVVKYRKLKAETKKASG